MSPNRATTTATAIRTYEIDTAHSEVTFQVRHLLSKVRGRFTDFSGTIAFDEQHPEDASVAFTIQAASVDTAQPDRDAHLRNTDFFAVDEHPTISFTSTGVTPRGNGRLEVKGTLTIRGIARAILLPVDHLGTAKDPWGNEKIAFETELTINRKEFGLTWNAALETGGFLVGDEVRIAISVQAK